MDQIFIYLLYLLTTNDPMINMMTKMNNTINNSTNNTNTSNFTQSKSNQTFLFNNNHNIIIYVCI